MFNVNYELVIVKSEIEIFNYFIINWLFAKFLFCKLTRSLVISFLGFNLDFSADVWFSVAAGNSSPISSLSDFNSHSLFHFSPSLPLSFSHLSVSCFGVRRPKNRQHINVYIVKVVKDTGETLPHDVARDAAQVMEIYDVTWGTDLMIHKQMIKEIVGVKYIQD
jgi:hypothetical protein